MINLGQMVSSLKAGGAKKERMRCFVICFSLMTQRRYFWAQNMLINQASYSSGIVFMLPALPCSPSNKCSVYSHLSRHPVPTVHKKCQLPHLYPTLCPLSGFSWLLPQLMQVSHLTGANGSGLFFSKRGGIVCQILVHHFIIGEEEEICLGTFDSLCIISNCKVKKIIITEKEGSNPGYQELLVFSSSTA